MPVDSPLTIWLSDLNSGHRDLGGSKAARLGELLCAGLPVPDGFCITHLAYSTHILASDRLQLQDLVQGRRYEIIRDLLLHTELDGALQTEVSTRYRQLQARCSGSVAVRSSSTAEDLSQHSFAGLYETVLDVSGEPALVDAIRRCWASFWTEEAVFYRDRLGLDHTQHGMAVLVQTMVRPELAGVLFTQAPARQGQDRLLIEFVQGEATSLVGGDARGERLVLDRESGRQLDASPAAARLPPSLSRRLFSLGLTVEDLLGTPQDIEWCTDAGGRMWILQARPITAMGAGQVPFQTALPSNWERVYDEPFSPLGCDLAVRRHRRWVDAINHYHRTAFEAKAKAVGGFVYRTTPWRSPGPLARLWMASWKLLRWLQAGRIHRQYEQLLLPAHVRRIAELESTALSALDNQALLDGFNLAVELYLELQYSSYPIGAAAATAASFLDRISRLLLGRASDLRGSDFLGGLDSLTVEHDLALLRLGQALAQTVSPDGAAGLDYARLLALREKDSAGQRFWLQLEAFQKAYGYVWADRYPRDPAWETDPEALAVSLIHAAQTPPGTGLSQGRLGRRQRRARAVEAAAQKLSASRFSLRWRIFSWFLRRAEQVFPHKEDRNHYVYQAAMVIRGYAQEVGRRLEAEGILLSEKAVFFLTWEEIQAALSGQGSPAILKAQAESRQHAYRASKQPSLGRTIGAPSTDTHPGVAEGDAIELRGEPCSPGVAMGPARLAKGSVELHQLRAGDILICRHLRPAWSPVLARIAGIVIEEGGLLSHGATLAREYGTPAVINVPGITRLVRDGSSIVVNGDRGLVSLHNPPLEGSPEELARIMPCEGRIAEGEPCEGN